MDEELSSELKRAREHLRWAIEYNKHLGLTAERKLGISDAIMEEVLIILAGREQQS